MAGNNRIELKRSSWADWPGWPYVLVGLAVALRLAHIWNSRSNPTFWAPAVDPAWYDDAAVRITQGQWGPFPLFRAPVYPILLAAVYSVFGHDLFAARILNVVLQGTTVWMIWHVGRSYFSSAVGVVSAVLFAVNGMAIFYACELVSPSAEMLASLLCAWTTLRLFRDSSFAAIIVCGLSYGLAAIIRPNFLFVFPVVLLVILYVNRREWGRWARGPLLSRVAVFVTAAFLPILPVTAANVIKGREFVLIATQGGINFWIGNNPESTGALAILPGYGSAWTTEDAETEAAKDVGHRLKSGELSNYYFQKGWHFLRESPASAARIMIRKAALFVNRNEISNNKDIRYFAALSPWLPWLINLNFGILFPLGVLGLMVGWRVPTAKVLLGLIVLYAISVILFFMTARFRMPIVPWLSWLAAAGLVWIAALFREKVNPRRLIPLFIMLPAIVLAYMDPWGLRNHPLGWARFMEGSAYLRLNQLDSARAGFTDAIRYGQEVDRALLNIGVIEYRLQNYAKAEVWYEQALAVNPNSSNTWNNLGIIHDVQGDTALAIESFHRALELNPLADDAKENLAGVYFRLGVRALKVNQDTLAIAYLDSAVTLHPNPAAYYNRALAFTRLGQNSQAEQSLNQAVALDPDLAGAPALREYLRSGGTSPPTGGEPR
jgi:Tfp pilus assembly protein PilF